MFKLSTLIICFTILQGCVSPISKSVTVSRNTFDNTLYVSLFLPTGNWNYNSHQAGFSEAPEIYSIDIEAGVVDIANKDEFVLKDANENVVQIKSGTIDIKSIIDKCEITIAIIPINKKNLLLNGVHKLDYCDET